MPSLHVNIDHAATIRQARRVYEPNLVEVIKLLEDTATAGFTLHLREDRRHIQDSDIYAVDQYLRDHRMSLTFEMGATEEIREICLKTKAKLSTIVPESREELTTEGGLDLLGQKNVKFDSSYEPAAKPKAGYSAKADFLAEYIKPIQANGTEVSLFIDPVNEQIAKAKEIGADFVELHTGTYANLFIEHVLGKDVKTKSREELRILAPQSIDKLPEIVKTEALRLKAAAEYAQSIGLKTNLGHGMTELNLLPMLEIPGIQELHIGHSIIANSIYRGIRAATEDILALIS